MSVTLERILELPSLRKAKLLSGKKSLNRIVSSISVLEYATVDVVQTRIFNNIDFYGNELVISSFASIKDDVEAQCNNIRFLSQAGEVGLILYYVGIVLPNIDKKIVSLADSLDFAIICMPENDPGLRYSEVICEVMEEVFKEQMNSPSISLEILDQVSRLPKQQQTVDTVLKIMRDRIRASFIITDHNLTLLNEAIWPRSLSILPSSRLKTIPLPKAGGPCIDSIDEPKCHIYRENLNIEGMKSFNFFMFKEGSPIDPAIWKQIVEAIQLSINLWNREHDIVDMTELIKAILQDEPIKMRRLAEILRVDVQAIQSMWILHPESNSDRAMLTDCARELRNLSSYFTKSLIAEFYQGDFLMLPIGPDNLQGNQEWAEELLSCCARKHIRATLTCCFTLLETHNVRSAFLAHQNHLKDAKSIFPLKRYYNLNDMVFAQECKEEILKGEEAVSQSLKLFDFIGNKKDKNELIDTLSIYLLDARCNIALTAQLQFVHKNTIKYRIQKLSDIYGFHIGLFPESLPLGRAAAIRRLLT